MTLSSLFVSRNVRVTSKAKLYEHPLALFAEKPGGPESAVGSDHSRSQYSPSSGGSQNRSMASMSLRVFSCGDKPPWRARNFLLIVAAIGRVSNVSMMAL